MGREYKKHLRGMVSELLPCFIFLCTLILVWTIAVKLVVLPAQREADALEEVGYTYVIESNGYYPEYNNMKKLDNIITVTSEGNRRCNVNVYICTDTRNDISSEQIEISEKMAEILKVQIGDHISVWYPIFDNPKEYEVVTILPYASDYYNVEDNFDFSLGIVGYDKTIYEKASGKSIYFMNNEDAAEFADRELSYISRNGIAEEVTALHRKMSIGYFAFYICLASLFACALWIMTNLVSKEVLKYYYDGFHITVVKTFYLLDFVLVCGAPLILLLILIENNLHSCEVVFKYGCYGTVIVMLITAICYGGRKFGKAN